MKTTTKTTLALVALAAMPFGMPAMAQEGAQDGEVLTTVYAPEVPAIDTMVEGPDIEGFISAVSVQALAWLYFPPLDWEFLFSQRGGKLRKRKAKGW